MSWKRRAYVCCCCCFLIWLYFDRYGESLQAQHCSSAQTATRCWTTILKQASNSQLPRLQHLDMSIYVIRHTFTMTDETFCAGCLLWGQNCGSIHICCDVCTRIKFIASNSFAVACIPYHTYSVFSFIFGKAAVGQSEWNILLCLWFSVFTEMENQLWKHHHYHHHCHHQIVDGFW